MACNNSDRRQRRKQGAVVGAAASEMQADAKQLLDKSEGDRVHHVIFQCPNENGKEIGRAHV